MTRREKLIQRIVKRPANASFEDVRQVLEMHGWTLARTSGSHHVFTKPGMRSYPVPAHNGVVKRRYVDELCGLLGLDTENEAE